MRLSLIEWAGMTSMYVFGVGPWLRYFYVTTRSSWQKPIRVAKLGSARMTSDSDVTGLY